MLNDAWRRRAACIGRTTLGDGTDVFYEDSERARRAAKAICADCPVRADCLAYALKAREAFGVWGGLSANERHVMRLNARR